MSEKAATSPSVALEARDQTEGRLFSPSAGRNKGDIASALSEILPIDARVLEIGSGTGEHGIETFSLRPDLHWQFSDPDPDSRASQAAWMFHVKYDLPAPLDLDMTKTGWSEELRVPYDVIFSANMIHIAPLEALRGLAEKAAEALEATGQILLYGPFLFGEASEPSNLEFDAVLKGKNPAWGVRELEFVKHIFAKQGFNSVQLRAMPKNNHIIGLSRG